MPLIQPMRLPPGTGQPDRARPAAHCPALVHDAIGDCLVTTELDIAPRSGATSWRSRRGPAAVPDGGIVRFCSTGSIAKRNFEVFIRGS
jgi:hypothetical protein